MARRPEVFVRSLSMEVGHKPARVTRTSKDPVRLRRAIVVMMSGRLGHHRVLHVVVDHEQNECPATRDRAGGRLDAGGMSGSDASREEALRRLPRMYSLALRLREAGVPGPVIAECVGVEPEAVGAMLVVGEAKLAAVRHEQQSPER